VSLSQSIVGLVSCLKSLLRKSTIKMVFYVVKDEPDAKRYIANLKAVYSALENANEKVTGNNDPEGGNVASQSRFKASARKLGFNPFVLIYMKTTRAFQVEQMKQ